MKASRTAGGDVSNNPLRSRNGSSASVKTCANRLRHFSLVPKRKIGLIGKTGQTSRSAPFHRLLGSNAGQRKTASRAGFLRYCRYRISSRSDQVGKLLVGHLQTLADDPDLYTIVEVKSVARASVLASGHRYLLVMILVRRPS